MPGRERERGIRGLKYERIDNGPKTKIGQHFTGLANELMFAYFMWDVFEISRLNLSFVHEWIVHTWNKSDSNGTPSLSHLMKTNQASEKVPLYADVMQVNRRRQYGWRQLMELFNLIILISALQIWMLLQKFLIM